MSEYNDTNLGPAFAGYETPDEKEIRRLEAIIKKQRKELEALRAERDSLQDDWNKVMEKVSEMAQAYIVLDAANSEYQKIVDQFKAENQQLKEKLQQANNLIAAIKVQRNA